MLRECDRLQIFRNGQKRVKNACVKLNMATAMFAETSDNCQNSTWPKAEVSH
jgi:hypothetical protein